VKAARTAKLLVRCQMDYIQSRPTIIRPEGTQKFRNVTVVGFCTNEMRWLIAIFTLHRFPASTVDTVTPNPRPATKVTTGKSRPLDPDSTVTVLSGDDESVFSS
jgi:hypothetical protein